MAGTTTSDFMITIGATGIIHRTCSVMGKWKKSRAIPARIADGGCMCMSGSLLQKKT